MIGNHHLGAGPPRDVDILKGVNTSFRHDLWRSSSAVRGLGAQPNLELEICLRARRRGWRLIYDADAVVDHFPAVRYDGGGRGEASADFHGETVVQLCVRDDEEPALADARRLRFRTCSSSETARSRESIQFVAASLGDRVGLRARLRVFAAVTRGHAGGVAAGLRARGRW